MSDHDHDLGPKPDAGTEPAEPNPGGADAVPLSEGVDPGVTDVAPLTRDLDPQENPDEEAVPDEVKQGEDTETQATKGDGDVPPDEEVPA